MRVTASDSNFSAHLDISTSDHVTAQVTTEAERRLLVVARPGYASILDEETGSYLKGSMLVRKHRTLFLLGYEDHEAHRLEVFDYHEVKSVYVLTN